MDLVKVSKQRLQVMRDDEWMFLLTEMSSFCTTHDIPILNMDEIFIFYRKMYEEPITFLPQGRVAFFFFFFFFWFFLHFHFAKIKHETSLFKEHIWWHQHVNLSVYVLFTSTMNKRFTR